ncbi:hypothetical protein ACHAWU_005243 [Discostella pseudostelligera]|uniref:Uncharacterized protein n=1 Tax=Discostella pseudostelligera TaxID=259834 RepID=A0ABD3M4V7_9STRA
MRNVGLPEKEDTMIPVFAHHVGTRLHSKWRMRLQVFDYGNELLASMTRAKVSEQERARLNVKLTPTY